MLIELGPIHILGDAVEITEKVGGDLPCLVGAFTGFPQQVINQRLGMHLLLNIERRRMNHQIAPVLPILTAPDQLRIEVGIAGVTHLFRILLFGLQHRLIFCRRDIPALGVVVLECLDGLGIGSLGHDL